jgi:ankyrin repeat protein
MYQEIMQAIFKGDIAKFDSLVQHGIDFNVVTESDKWNLLHRSLVSVSIPPTPAIIRKLIDYGVDVNARDRYGNTPLHYAARLKSTELIEMLLDAGAEIDPVNKDGLTPLRLMLLSKPVNLAAVELFLSRGANVNQRVEGGISVKEYAKIISHGDTAGLIALFDKYSNGPATG